MLAAVDRALPDQKMDPLVGGVAAEQRVVEIEERRRAMPRFADAAFVRAVRVADARLHTATSSPYSSAAVSSHVQR